MRFSLYYIYEEDMTGAEVDLVWDLDYKQNPQIGIYGHQHTFDFNNKCSMFISGSKQGWICFWSILEKKLEC